VVNQDPVSVGRIMALGLIVAGVVFARVTA
jgi:hypothetical protein